MNLGLHLIRLYRYIVQQISRYSINRANTLEILQSCTELSIWSLHMDNYNFFNSITHFFLVETALWYDIITKQDEHAILNKCLMKNNSINTLSSQDKIEWLTFCRRHCQIYIYEWKDLSFQLSLKYVPIISAYDKSVLLQARIWNRTTELMVTKFLNAMASSGPNELIISELVSCFATFNFNFNHSVDWIFCLTEQLSW